ncbi:hypothetical protein FKM82_026679, partial [Ascaphus truei]
SVGIAEWRCGERAEFVEISAGIAEWRCSDTAEFASSACSSELSILRSTALLTALLQRVTAPPLLRRLLVFLLGEERAPERRSDALQGPQLRAQLIQRCNHLSDEISLASLRLFEQLLQAPQELAMHNLLIRNLENQGYMTRGQEESWGHEGEAWEGTDYL